MGFQLLPTREGSAAVEGEVAPFWAVIDFVFGEDEATVAAGVFAATRVMGDGGATAVETLVAETMGEQDRIYPTGELEGDGQIPEPWRISLPNTETSSAMNFQHGNQLCRRDGYMARDCPQPALRKTGSRHEVAGAPLQIDFVPITPKKHSNCP